MLIGVAEAETLGEPDAATDGEALMRADGETAFVAVGEAVAVAAPHPATRSATAVAAQKSVLLVTLEGRLIDSPIGGRLRPRARAGLRVIEPSMGSVAAACQTAGSDYFREIPTPGCNPRPLRAFC